MSGKLEYDCTVTLQIEKKEKVEKEEKDDAVRARTNLSIPLLPEREQDKRLAALLSYQTPDCEFSQIFTESCTEPFYQSLFYIYLYAHSF